MKLRDSNNVVRNLESDANGNLVWDGSNISSPLGTTQANPIQNLFMVGMLTNVKALFLTQPTNGTRDLNWGTNSEYKSYKCLEETYLNAIKDCVAGASPVSLGPARASNNFKIACYENASTVTSFPVGHYFYGMALVRDAVNSLGLFANGGIFPDLGSNTSQTGTGYEEPIMVLTTRANKSQT